MQRLKKLLVEKPQSNTIRAAAARRAVALLSGLGTPAARALLKELAERDPTSELGSLAAAAAKFSFRCAMISR